MTKNFFKIMGIILGVFIIGNFIFYYGVDKTFSEFTDMGWFKTLVLLMGLVTGSAVDQFIICGIAFYIIQFLNNKEILNFDDKINIILGYVLSVVINFGFRFFYLERMGKEIMNFENIFITVFVPIIYSFLMFRIVKRFVKK